MKLKEKLVGLLGTFGGVLYFAICALLFVLPVSMISNTFDFPFWIDFLMISALLMFRGLDYIAWIVGFVCALKGPQDTLAIVFYIAFAIMIALPFIIWLISFVGSAIYNFFNKD